MSAAATHATPPDNPGPPAAGTPAADTEFYRQALHDLINVGTSLARHLPAQADAQAAQQATTPAPQPTSEQPGPAPAPPPSDALVRIVASFDPLARAVRRCIAQAQSLNTPKPQLPARTPAPADRTAARKRILRAIEDNIQRPPDHDDLDDPETLLADLYERMDAPDLDEEIANRPVPDIIKDICRDLGLAALPGTRPWKRRTPADIAELCARAAAPSSPAWPATPKPGPQDRAPTAPPATSPADEREPGPSNPTQPKPGRPAAPARAPVLPSHTLPADPAEAVAFVLHHHALARSRPPPGD